MPAPVQLCVLRVKCQHVRPNSAVKSEASMNVINQIEN